MTTHEKVLYVVVAVLVVRSVYAQIYIRRLKSAMLNICEAMERTTGITIRSKLRGGNMKILP